MVAPVEHLSGETLLVLARGVIPRNVPAHLRDDLAQDAALAGVVAQRNYRSDKGASMRTWVLLRMRGAVLDALRTSGRLIGWSRTRGEHTNHLAFRSELLVTLSTSSAFHRVDARLDAEDALRALPRRTARMLALRFGLDGNHPRTQAEIAAEFRLCNERISQILGKVAPFGRGRLGCE